jgi:hypothetical protein
MLEKREHNCKTFVKFIKTFKSLRKIKLCTQKNMKLMRDIYIF